MLDIQFIRENRGQVQKDATDKGVEVSIDELLEIDENRRELITKVEDARQRRNENSASMKGGKPSPEQIEAGKALKEEVAEAEAKLEGVEAKYKDLMLLVPNVLHDSVKRGEGESANEVVKTVGKKPEFDFEPLDHEALAEKLDLIDLETASKTSGSRFYYLKNDAVRLEFAMVQWLLEKFSEKGFIPVTTPMLVRESMMEATGFFPADKNEIYSVNPGEDDLYLIGTAEVPLAGLHMFEPLAEEDAPKRYIGFSSAFRREAGSYGKDTKGIFRVHQFDKMEMYSFVKPEDSWDEHEFLLSIEEEIMNELGLHYQVINIGSGDLGAPAAKKYDCEVWIPSQGRYRELTSCSNTTDFQTRRGNIKLKNKDGLRYAHTLNGTAFASTRTLIALLETHQTADGHVNIPEVLQPYMGGKKQI